MIKIYTLPYCPYCINAINLLNKLDVPYNNIIVKEHEKSYYKNKHNYSSFPQIFFHLKDNMWDNKAIGYDDLELIIKICNALNNTEIDNGTLFLGLEHIKNKCKSYYSSNTNSNTNTQ